MKHSISVNVRDCLFGRMTRVTHTRPVMTSLMVHVHVSMAFQLTDSSAKVKQTKSCAQTTYHIYNSLPIINWKRFLTL